METPLWVPIVVAAVSAVPATIGAILGLRNHAKLDKLEINIDGRLSQLLQITASSSHAEGVKEERDKGIV